MIQAKIFSTGQSLEQNIEKAWEGGQRSYFEKEDSLFIITRQR